MLMTIKFPLEMSERAFVCQLTLLNIDTYSNILIESSINTNEMFSRVNEKRIYVIDITFGTNESIFSGNEQQKAYSEGGLKMIDIASFNRSLKATWIKRYLDKENCGRWKRFLT